MNLLRLTLVFFLVNTHTQNMINEWKFVEVEHLISFQFTVSHGTSPINNQFIIPISRKCACHAHTNDGNKRKRQRKIFNNFSDYQFDHAPFDWTLDGVVYP